MAMQVLAKTRVKFKVRYLPKYLLKIKRKKLINIVKINGGARLLTIQIMKCYKGKKRLH